MSFFWIVLQVPDAQKLIARIKNCLIALYEVKNHLPPDEPEDSYLKIDVLKQIELQRSKFIHIAGVNALQQFDEELTTMGLLLSSSKNNLSSSSTFSTTTTSFPERMTNEGLAHEIILNPAFQFGDDGTYNFVCPTIQRISESFHKVSYMLFFFFNFLYLMMMINRGFGIVWWMIYALCNQTM